MVGMTVSMPPKTFLLEGRRIICHRWRNPLRPQTSFVQSGQPSRLLRGVPQPTQRDGGVVKRSWTGGSKGRGNGAPLPQGTRRRSQAASLFPRRAAGGFCAREAAEILPALGEVCRKEIAALFGNHLVSQTKWPSANAWFGSKVLRRWAEQTLLEELGYSLCTEEERGLVQTVFWLCRTVFSSQCDLPGWSSLQTFSLVSFEELRTSWLWKEDGFGVKNYSDGGWAHLVNNSGKKESMNSMLHHVHRNI